MQWYLLAVDFAHGSRFVCCVIANLRSWNNRAHLPGVGSHELFARAGLYAATLLGSVGPMAAPDFFTPNGLG
jgi:transposase